MRKLKQQEVESKLEKMGFELLSVYKNTKTTLKLKHIKCGKPLERSFNHLQNNPKCPKCHPPKTVKKSIKRVREIVERKYGHKLLSTKYINNRAPIQIECLLSGERVTTTLKSFMNSKRCKACSLMKMKAALGKIRQGKLEEIKSEMAKEDYQLRAEEYINNKQRLAYICPQNHYGSVNWNNWLSGQRCYDCNYEGMKGSGNPRWLGGLVKRNLASYKTYASQLEKYEKIRSDSDEPKILEARCTYCGKWFRPARSAVKSRIEALNTSDGSENRLYCSKECKLECPIFHKMKYPAGFKELTSREVQAELRQMVFERDNWECQRCGKTKPIHCHHITGIKQNPIESADVDNCISLCKKCHQWAHTQKGCRYFELRCQ